MKKKQLVKLLKHQQALTLRALDLLKQAYDQDNTAVDEGSSGPMHIPSVHDPIRHIEPETMRHYR